MSNPSGTEFPFSWLSLAGIILLQTVSGTRSADSALAQHFCISQVQLNYLIVALDIGKVLGWFSGIAAEYLPTWMILFIGLIIESVGYGLQYLCTVKKIHSLSFWQLFLLNVLAGNSSSWINTYCQLVATQKTKEHVTVNALTSSYSGLSGKIYTSLVEGFHGRKGSQNPSSYLLLSCIAPAIVGLAVVLLISCPKLIEHGEISTFPIVFVIAIVTGVYYIIESTIPPFNNMSPQLRVVLLLSMITLPLAVPLGKILHQFASKKWNSRVMPENSQDIRDGKVGVSIDIAGESMEEEVVNIKMGNEHKLKELVMSVNFWLYFLVNACGPTLGTVYLNNIGRISDSWGSHGAPFLVSISSAFVFFGRILCIVVGWYTRERTMVPRPATIMVMMIPMSASFFLLISESNICLYVCTVTLGTCSGAMTAIAATTTSELFGLNNSRVNHNIVLTNIPIGSLLFGYLAALNYDRGGGGKYGRCKGFKCHRNTFIIWGSISSVGTILSIVLRLRTQKLYIQ
ncbi:protein NUCLEAR FUSION DEFECTIVE 4-like [Malania oleifera]|uniref:protein NUCLEAR FUSION DEFECTIVE 4-like n=1 Tax=Malania oleifera TaxID=397392 RepID=UPI0025AE3383|nr:protein NUCLEAR FUSION DEFECTIVE 4-like [Malania oleifera]